MRVCVWLYVWEYVCMDMCMYVWICVCMHVCASVWVYVCMCVCMSACMYVCMYMCAHVCVSVIWVRGRGVRKTWSLFPTNDAVVFSRAHAQNHGSMRSDLAYATGKNVQSIATYIPTEEKTGKVTAYTAPYLRLRIPNSFYKYSS